MSSGPEMMELRNLESSLYFSKADCKAGTSNCILQMALEKASPLFQASEQVSSRAGIVNVGQPDPEGEAVFTISHTS